MKKLLDKNSIAAGVLLTVGSEAICGLLLWCVLLMVGQDAGAHVRWFAVAFVPPLLLLRHYAHQKEHPLTLKAVIVTFFVTFAAFMWVMLRYRYITFN